jgi:hypothetical protein
VWQQIRRLDIDTLEEIIWAEKFLVNLYRINFPPGQISAFSVYNRKASTGPFSK